MKSLSDFDLLAWAYSPASWIVTVLVAATFYTSLPQATVYANFPRVGWTIFQRLPVHKVVAEGYRDIIKPQKRPVVVRWWAKDYLILPAKYLVDLRAARWGHLHFFRNISDALFLYTTVGDLYTSPVAERMVDVVKKGLNPRLPQITSTLLDEIDYGFQTEIKFEGKEVKEVTAMKFFGSIVHRCACRIMIGTELCRDEVFLKETTNLLESIFFTAILIIKLPLGPLRPAMAWLLTALHGTQLRKCARLLRPVVLERIEKRRMGSIEAEENIGDAIEWTLNHPTNDPKYDSVEHLTHELLHNLWAASSAPGGMMTQIVYQLLTHPQYLKPLREEAEKAVKESGWTEKMLASLRLQDSFIREVNRLFPTGAITCSRTVVGTPFEFSDGLKLPVGTRFGFPIQAMQSDDETFDNPLRFDGFRFAKSESDERTSPEESHGGWSSTTMSPTNLAWGYGNHICPGRFFAVRELKLILTKLLLEYDISWHRDNGTGCPKPVEVEGQFVPNLTQTVVLRPRSGV